MICAICGAENATNNVLSARGQEVYICDRCKKYVEG